jgi:hypothetical protein
VSYLESVLLILAVALAGGLGWFAGYALAVFLEAVFNAFRDL